MSSESVDRPPGLYIIIGLVVIGTIGIVYFAITFPGYISFAAFALPVWLYMIVGLFRGWKWARRVTIGIMTIFLVLAVLNIAALTIFGPEELGLQSDPVLFIVRSAVRVIVLPIAIWYLFSESVRKYFAGAA
jgi:hypothetical protein